jgi:hypothetical protein
LLNVVLTKEEEEAEAVLVAVMRIKHYRMIVSPVVVNC